MYVVIMRLLISRLIDSIDIDSQEQFEAELNEWLSEKGYTSLSEQSILLPELASPVKVGSGTDEPPIIYCEIS
ncbi:hypothetical protein [Bacillus sp. V5-8f]|uniref:hypothetical protein n=1 Tax=Bacillus sp. V5-8f TaxID=2053044 RepID=UPI000C794FCF|nr:hypothetical protein [Bacillus sp. V5-8f]PLT31970.1 hypothetical protein CUU64_20500 [Bacillus sp. V5-8f]